MSDGDMVELKRLRDACRKVADEYDEFGEVFGETFDELYKAEDAFWRATELPPDAALNTGETE